MANKNPNKSTRFQPGVSGNKNGRPKGRTNKWSNAKIAEELSKGTKSALDTIRNAFESNKESTTTRIKAACGWMVELDKANKRAIEDTFNKIKIEQEKVNLELAKEKLKEKLGDTSENSKEEDFTPVISLVAHKGGKNE